MAVLHRTVAAGLPRLARAVAGSEERGDVVIGWVLVVGMTVALVLMVWAIASSAIGDLITRFLHDVNF